MALYPEVDGGRYPIKRVVGDRMTVGADVLADGHDVLAGVLRYRGPGDETWRETPLSDAGNDRWEADFELDRLGRWEYGVSAWVDHFATWRHGTKLKVEAGTDIAVELLIGAALVAAALERVGGGSGKPTGGSGKPTGGRKGSRGKTSQASAEVDPDREILREAAAVLGNLDVPAAARTDAGLDPRLAAAMARHPDRSLASDYDRVLSIVVDRERARYSTWYEMFPRSCGAPGQHGTFADATGRLGYVASMGFDVLYLPPIHPIGLSHRKGRNNSLSCDPSDPGSPWAIGGAIGGANGDEAGGHTAIHPELGTLDDFLAFQKAAREHGLEIALDIAFQASPDHPWVKQHPDWFKKRPDGTIQYAENPPKKYQDIYPLDFESKDWKALWEALRDVFMFWAENGVRIFRVDNPHTKGLRFWEWCIGEIKATYPEAIFLAEAFTRPKLMHALAKLGFSQSYTYFTWRHTAHELREYMVELTQTEVAEFFRPNFWPNTPDILPDHLAHAGFGAFAGRLILAATLTASYGIYGPAFELMENVPRPGSGEYLDNEKYQLKSWDLDRADSLRFLIGRINHIRRGHPALHDNELLHFHDCDNPQILVYSKRSADGSDVILCAVNLDPHHTQSGFVSLDLSELGIREGASFTVHDLLREERYQWNGVNDYIELDPHAMPAHILEIGAA